jgi:hypothetical protein
MRLETPLDPEQPLPRPNPENSVIHETENGSVAELEPEPKFGILAPWSRSRKNIFGPTKLGTGTVLTFWMRSPLQPLKLEISLSIKLINPSRQFPILLGREFGFHFDAGPDDNF